jgi:hypothetical protein
MTTKFETVFHGMRYPLDPEFDPAFQHILLGEFDLFEKELKRLQLRHSREKNKAAVFDEHLYDLLIKVESASAMDVNVLAVLSKFSFNSETFRVGMRRFIANRFLADDMEGFHALHDWFFKHLETHRLANGRCVSTTEDKNHLGFMASDKLVTTDGLAAFNTRLPLMPPMALKLMRDSDIDRTAIVNALQLHTHMYMVRDSVLTGTVNNFARRNSASSENAFVADFGEYLCMAGYLSAKGDEDIAALIVERAIHSPLATNSNFCLSRFNAYNLVFNRTSTAFVDMLVRNEDRLLFLVDHYQKESKSNPKSIHALSAQQLRQIGTDKYAGLRDTTRDFAEMLAEAGAKRLSRLITLNSHDVMMDEDCLGRIDALIGPFTADELIAIYTRSCGSVISSMQDTQITNLKPFLNYALNHDLDISWRGDSGDKGLAIVSVAKQLGQIHEAMKESVANGGDESWWMQHMQSAILSIPQNAHPLDRTFGVLATRIGQDELNKINLYKRKSLSQDMGL